MTERDHILRLFERSTKAVKNAADSSGVRLHHFQGVVPGIALMNDDIQSCFDREIELLFKKCSLLVLVSAIRQPGIDLLFRLAL